ncbi:response regulator transcription factor [Candidatus Bipolaricaulota bacterium]|nr:response regulator transcription factor [Candidatus Bipolaricaulota bacterium]
MISVVLAEDHILVRDGLRLLLESQQDIEVVGEASDGRAALRLVKETCPDVVLLDVSMPELDGIEVARRIKRDYPETRCIILSMHANAHYAQRAMEAGAIGFIVKGAPGQELVDAVRAASSGHRFLSQVILDALGERLARPDAGENRIARLTPRELQVLTLVVEGKTSAEIGETLYLSSKTVDSYRSRLMAKLEVTDVPSLVKLALRHGLTTLD